MADASERKYRDLFERANLGIILHTVDGRILDANQKALAIFQYDKKEFLKLRVIDLHPPSALPASQAAFAQIVREKAVNFAIDFQRRSGEIFPAEVSSSLLEIDGRPLIQAILTDITARRQRQETLRRRRREWETIFNAMSDWVMLLDLETRVLRSNQAGEEFLQQPAASIIGKSCCEIVHGEAAPIPGCPVRQMIRSHRREKLEFYHQKSGRWLLAAADPVFDESGNLAGAVHTIRDISARKKAALAQEASEARFRSLAENAPSRVTVVNRQGKILYINRVSPTRTMAEVIGGDFYRYLTADEQKKARKILARVFENGEKVVYEARIEREDGTIVWYENHVGPMPEFEEEETAVLISLDISQRKRQEAALAAYSQQLEEMVAARTQELADAQEQLVRQEKLAALGQLSGGLAHELRNPLSVISGAAYFLTMALADVDAETADAIEILNKEVENAEAIINGLLNFARTQKPRLESVAVNDVLTDLLGRMAIPENISVVTDLADDLPHIPADPQQLTLICRNLIRNAVQAMEDGGQLTASTQAEAEGVVITIADTGPGFSPENRDKLFTPLFTTKAKGLGLGLALVKALVEGHGGMVTAVSEQGVGASFIIQLPL